MYVYVCLHVCTCVLVSGTFGIRTHNERASHHLASLLLPRVLSKLLRVDANTPSSEPRSQILY